MGLLWRNKNTQTRWACMCKREQRDKEDKRAPQQNKPAGRDAYMGTLTDEERTSFDMARARRRDAIEADRKRREKLAARLEQLRAQSEVI
jgi:hypothetical protein